MLESMTAIHDSAKAHGYRVKATDRAEKTYPRFEHPVVRTHPVTGRKALFVNPVYTQRFHEMTAEESRPLLHYLFEHATKAEFTCRLRWAPGTLAIWDNRCLMHLAINDYDGSRRLLHRTTVAGERPVGVIGESGP